MISFEQIYCEANHLTDSIECAEPVARVGALELEPEQHHLHPHSCLPWMPQGAIEPEKLTMKKNNNLSMSIQRKYL